MAAMVAAPLLGQTAPGAPPAKSAAPKRSVWAQLDTTSVIHGAVTDSAGHPVDDIEVYVVTSGRSAHTDAAGRYLITGIIEGPTRLRARRLGWKPVDTAVVVAAHSSVAVNFRLGSRISALDTIRVTASQDACRPRELAGFQCRRRAGVGVFRDSAELAALEPEYVADLFDGIPGLRREGHNVKAVTRWRCISYLFNGHPPTALDRMTARMLSFPQDVVAIEFYEDHQTAPERYKIYAGRCSLIVFWMKGAS